MHARKYATKYVTNAMNARKVGLYATDVGDGTVVLIMIIRAHAYCDIV